MKRVLVATILGLVATASSYGQASYAFDTYLPFGAAGYPAGQVWWTTDAALAPAGLAGTLDNGANGLVANLLWQVGTASGVANLAPSAVTSFGLIDGGVVNFFPAYAGTPIDFTIQVWQTGGPVTGYADAVYKGAIAWTDPGQAVGAGTDRFNPSAFPTGPIVVTGIVPEPTTLALAGLGALSMLIFRKR